MLVLGIELIQGMVFVHDFVLEVPYDFLELMDVGSSFIFDLISFLIALILRSSHVEDVLWSWLTKRGTDFFHGFLVNGLEHFLSGPVGLIFEDQVIESAGKAMHLHVVQEEFVQASHQLACCCLSVQLSEGMQESVIGV